MAFPIDRLRLVTATAPLQNATQVRLTDADGLPIPATVIAKGDKLAVLEVQASAIEGGVLRYLNLGQSFTGGPVRWPRPSGTKSIRPVSVADSRPIRPAAPAGRMGHQPRRTPAPRRLAPARRQGEVIGVAIPASRDDPRTKLPAVALEGAPLLPPRPQRPPRRPLHQSRPTRGLPGNGRGVAA